MVDPQVHHLEEHQSQNLTNNKKIHKQCQQFQHTWEQSIFQHLQPKVEESSQFYMEQQFRANEQSTTRIPTEKQEP